MALAAALRFYRQHRYFMNFIKIYLLFPTFIIEVPNIIFILFARWFCCSFPEFYGVFLIYSTISVSSTKAEYFVVYIFRGESSAHSTLESASIFRYSLHFLFVCAAVTWASLLLALAPRHYHILSPNESHESHDDALRYFSVSEKNLWNRTKYM